MTTDPILGAMASFIRTRAGLGWSLEDRDLIEALTGARYTPAEITTHLDAAKEAALSETPHAQQERARECQPRLRQL